MKLKLLWLAPIMALQMFALPASAYNGKLMNGKAVSTQFRFGSFSICEASSDPWRGSLVVYTIQNSKVVKADTIYKSQLGFAHYPAFNLAGTKIAFYRFGQGLAENGSACATVNGGKSYISVINTDGTGLTNLCEIPTPSGNENFPLDWPAGDSIFFMMPHDAAHTYGNNNASTMIWCVNATGTPVARRVCNFASGGSGAEEICNAIRRFTLSVKGDRMATQYVAGGKAGCTADPINNAENCIHEFPGTCNISSNLGCAAGCNISISPSGLIKGSYFAGNHDCLFLDPIGNGPGVPFAPQVFIKVPTWDIGAPLNILAGLAGNLTKWNGDAVVGNGAELIRWSANSDKWVMQKIGMHQSGHASNNNLGSNQIVCNFIDSVAINISKNPVPPNPVPQDYIFWNNDAGDLWVNDPGNNPNGNRYEDIQGIWHSRDGAVAGPRIVSAPTAVLVTIEKDSASATKTLQISNIGSGTLGALSAQVRYPAGSTTDWVAASVSGMQVTLQFTTATLPANYYTAMLAVFAAGSGDTAYVPVALSVQVARNPENPTNTQQGLFYKYYQGKWLPIPNLDSLTPVRTGTCANFGPYAPGRTDQFAYSFSGYLDVPVQGIYTFYLNADDMANLYIGSELINTFGRGDGNVSKNSKQIFDKGPIALKAGKHAIRVDYTEIQYDTVLVVSWESSKAGIVKQAIPANKLFNTGGSTLSLRAPQLRATLPTTRILYNLQGRRVGVLVQNAHHRSLQGTSKGLFLAVPEKLDAKASAPQIILR